MQSYRNRTSPSHGRTYARKFNAASRRHFLYGRYANYMHLTFADWADWCERNPSIGLHALDGSDATIEGLLNEIAHQGRISSGVGFEMPSDEQDFVDPDDRRMPGDHGTKEATMRETQNERRKMTGKSPMTLRSYDRSPDYGRQPAEKKKQDRLRSKNIRDQARRELIEAGLLPPEEPKQPE